MSELPHQCPTDGLQLHVFPDINAGALSSVRVQVNQSLGYSQSGSVRAQVRLLW